MTIGVSESLFPAASASSCNRCFFTALHSVSLGSSWVPFLALPSGWHKNLVAQTESFCGNPECGPMQVSSWCLFLGYVLDVVHQETKRDCHFLSWISCLAFRRVAVVYGLWCRRRSTSTTATTTTQTDQLMQHYHRCKIITDRIIILGNYLEIGNALPYQKNCFQELFGPVIVIKSVMENLAGKVLFFLFVPEKPGKAPPLSAQLAPLMLVSLASGLVLAQAFFWGQEISAFCTVGPEEAVTLGYSGKNSEFGITSVKKITVTGKIAAGNYLAIRNAKPYWINWFQN